MLKIIAIAAMLADHVNILLLGSEYDVLFWLGRLALPLFCYLLVVGFVRTASVNRYIRRLLIFGVLAQPIYIWAFDYPIYYLNILFTLAFALFVLQRLNEIGPLQFIALLFPAALLFEGGVQVILLTLAFYAIIRRYRVFIPDVRFRLSKFSFYAFYPMHLFVLRLFA